MKPVGIFRHSPGEGPGYFTDFLESHQIPWQLIAIDEGDPVPIDPTQFSGLCFMGGPMSVNDPLPWIEPVCELIRQAIAQDIPVLGHCLGGQLMSKALGGTITRNPVKEIGWSTCTAEPSDLAAGWLGELAHASQTLFQWHGETFSIPPQATRLLRNAHCANQAFVLGPHLGLQCHVEMTPEMIAHWCDHWEAECGDLPEQASIQTPAVMLSEIPSKLPDLRRLADQLYGQWIQHLR